MIHLYIWNQSSLVTDDQVQTATEAIQRQIAEDFEPAWGVSAVLHFLPRSLMPLAGTWVIKIVDKSDEPGALGYHTDGRDNVASGVVGVQTCLDDNVSWTSCLSHEVLELIADPECVRCFQFDNVVVALEPCDACEGVGYTVDGIEVSDFCYPAYFVQGAPGPYNKLGTLHSTWPALLSGGYSSSAPVDHWSQQNADKVRASKQSVGINSRRAKRAT